MLTGSAVYLQVNQYAALHGLQYGMITNLQWSWAFKMDGQNNVHLSQAFCHDASDPTVLQVCV